MKPAAPSMRHAPTDAARRELSKSVEFLKIGSLDQMLWLRDLDAVYGFDCDTRVYQMLYIWPRGLDAVRSMALTGIAS